MNTDHCYYLNIFGISWINHGKELFGFVDDMMDVFAEQHKLSLKYWSHKKRGSMCERDIGYMLEGGSLMLKVDMNKCTNFELLLLEKPFYRNKKVCRDEASFKGVERIDI